MKRIAVFITGIFGLVVVASMLWQPHNESRMPDQALPTVTTIPINPLNVAAFRQHQLTNGEITIAEDLGTKGKYHSYIISYPSDNLTLRALMNVPITAKPEEGYPVFILNHGYIPPKEYSTQYSYSSFTDYYANNGYLVIKPDYRGNAQSEGDPVNPRLSPEYVYDVLNLVNAVKKYKDANPNKIGMMGHSMGGGITLYSVLISKDLKAAILAAGVVGTPKDIYDAAHGGVKIPPPQWIITGAEGLVNVLGDPRQNPKAWEEVSQYNYLNDIAVPIQIVHGTADTDVPVEFSQHLNAELQAKGKQAEYVEMPNGDHNFNSPFRAQFYTKTLTFLDKHLK